MWNPLADAGCSLRGPQQQHRHSSSFTASQGTSVWAVSTLQGEHAPDLFSAFCSQERLQF